MDLIGVLFFISLIWKESRTLRKGKYPSTLFSSMSNDVRTMAVGIDELTERLLKCLKEVDDLNDELDSLKTWTNSLEELSAIIDAFEVDEKNRLQGKTILDVGTSGVKPLYIALKYEPHKIVGINEDFSGFSIASEVEPRSKLLTKTKIRFHS